MPFNYTFPPNSNIHRVKVRPTGWNGEITIEYTSAQINPYDPMRSIAWRVVGTQHTFTIYEQRINVLSKGNYANHFTDVLEKFADQYQKWFEPTDEISYNTDGVDWREEYKQQYGKFIKC